MNLDFAPQCVPAPEPDPTKPRDHYLNHSYGWLSWLFTVDHKRIGILYLVTVTIFFAAGATAAGLVRLNLLTPTSELLPLDSYNKAFTAHGTVMLFLFLIPVVPGVLGNFLVPMMIGAKDMAFPKLNLLSWYIFMIGAAFFLWTLLSGGIDTGWTLYPPYSSQYSHTNVLYAGLGIFTAGFSSILTGLNIIVTIHKMRAPGMTWNRLPLFIWAMYATSLIQLLATPVLAVTVLLLAVERVFGIGIFDPTLEGDPVLFQHMFWFYSHPAVYVMILPGMGVVNEVITCFSRKNIFGYAAVAWSSVGIAVVGFLVWGHHMFLSGQGYYMGMLFSFITMLVAVPSAIKVFNWSATLYKGSITFEAPMLFTLGFIALFTIGGVTGLYLGVMGTDIHLHDTYFVVAHFHFTMVGGMMLGWQAGLHFWWPKMTGKMYSDFWSRLSAVTICFGFFVTFIPQFIAGYNGMPRRYPNYAPEFQILNVLSTAGAFIQGIGYLMPVFYLTASLVNGKPAGNNPWRATGLEWQTPSPPPQFNFDETPIVACGPYEYSMTSDEVYKYIPMPSANGVHTGKEGVHVSADAHGPGYHHAHHFDSLGQQQSTVRFGMWLFLVTEVLFFGGIMSAYTVYRTWYPDDFEAGSAALNPLAAIINSVLLLTSSFTITLGVRAAYEGNVAGLRKWIMCTIVLGVGFLGLKANEYYTDYKEGLIPTKAEVVVHVAKTETVNGHTVTTYDEVHQSVFAQHLEHVLKENEREGLFDKCNPYRVQLFFMFYYCMTGLHVLHMAIGIGLLIWQYILAGGGFFNFKERYVYVEAMSLYWHFVDMVWMFLLPLLYLAGPHSFDHLSL